MMCLLGRHKWGQWFPSGGTGKQWMQRCERCGATSTTDVR